MAGSIGRRSQSRRHSDRDNHTDLSRHPRAASCAGGTAQWRDAPNIGQGFWSPDKDQKQADCKERPAPQ